MLLIEAAVLYKILLAVLLGLYWAFEATWLAWLFGNNSDKVLERFRIISEVSQPRENEPPACEWVGSHHSNEVRFEDLNPDQS